jgi:hypothetical protein
MLADAVVENIKSDLLVSSVPAAIPENESQSRPLQGLPPEQQVAAARIVAQKPGKRTAKDFKDAADTAGGKLHVKKPEVEADEPEEKPHIKSYTPPSPSVSTTRSKDEDDGECFDTLLELVDKAQTQARKAPGCLDVAKQLGDIAKKVQQIKAKGAL